MMERDRRETERKKGPRKGQFGRQIVLQKRSLPARISLPRSVVPTFDRSSLLLPSCVFFLAVYI